MVDSEACFSSRVSVGALIKSRGLDFGTRSPVVYTYTQALNSPSSSSPPTRQPGHEEITTTHKPPPPVGMIHAEGKATHVETSGACSSHGTLQASSHRQGTASATAHHNKSLHPHYYSIHTAGREYYGTTTQAAPLPRSRANRTHATSERASQKAHPLTSQSLQREKRRRPCKLLLLHTCTEFRLRNRPNRSHRLMDEPSVRESPSVCIDVWSFLSMQPYLPTCR